MKKFPIALQLYTVREEMNRDFTGTLQKVKALGYEGVEFAGLFGKSAVEVKAILETVGLIPVSAHVPLDDLLADPDGMMETYAAIGCKFVAVPWLDEKRRPGGAAYEAVTRGVQMLAGRAGKHGLTLLYHNHDFEFVKIGAQYALDVLFETIPALATELDTCWVAVAGEDPAHYVEKYTGRAPVVHLKDYVLPGQKPAQMYELIGVKADENQEAGAFEFRPLGCGMQDFPAILAAAEKAGTQWVVVEQDRPSMGKTPLECAQISMQYLQSIL